ncbi:DUF2637 domain-containing protein [Streptomyces uncialis]|nr:DUF2637 domain-containing protein [Streptomyces uncialis]
MNSQAAERWALAAAGAVIIALTAGAFWLSYAHLAEIAGQHGLGHSPARQWAWPASLDAAIIAGELLMLRAGLRKEVDWWAIALTAGGSVGSIALNIAGVNSTDRAGSIPVLDYVVAAVPPTAALVAFGVLMRQIHQLVTEPTDHSTTTAADTTPETMPATVAEPRYISTRQTGTTERPDHGTGPQTRSEGADQAGSSAADHARTTAADQPPVGADHGPAPGPPRTSTVDQPAADQDQAAADQSATGPDHAQTTSADQTDTADQPHTDHSPSTPRTSITAGHTPDQAAEQQRTTQPTTPGTAVDYAADHPVNTSSHQHTTADHRPDRTAEKPADHPLPGPNHAIAVRSVTGPDHPRTTTADQTADVRDQQRTTAADQGGDEPVPMERLVEIAREAALAEGRMTRRVIRPYLRSLDIQISNERFSALQTLLQQDSALAHLPQPQRKARPTR